MNHVVAFVFLLHSFPVRADDGEVRNAFRDSRARRKKIEGAGDNLVSLLCSAHLACLALSVIPAVAPSFPLHRARCLRLAGPLPRLRLKNDQKTSESVSLRSHLLEVLRHGAQG